MKLPLKKKQHRTPQGFTVPFRLPLTSEMAAFKKKPFKRYRRRYRRKGKWRQQKLAVGTVQKIAREIAKKEDKKNMEKFVHVTYIAVAGYVSQWAQSHVASLPASTSWFQLGGAGAMLSKLCSGIGGHIGASNLPALDAAEQGQVQLRIHGIESFGIVQNNSALPVRCEIRIVYVPNTNVYTDDANDYLVPRLTMFAKSGKGLGALLRQGYDRKSLAVFDTTSNPVKYQTYARKVIYLPAATMTGTITQGGSIDPILINALPVRRRFKLSKYFKNPKKAFCRANHDELSNGNYFLVAWTDAPLGTTTVSFLSTQNVQYSLKGAMRDDTS